MVICFFFTFMAWITKISSIVIIHIDKTRSSKSKNAKAIAKLEKLQLREKETMDKENR